MPRQVVYNRSYVLAGFLPLAAFVWLLALLVSPAHALPADKRLDQCRLDTWGIRDGLPGYDITALAQTRDGFLWVGTTQGLLRFDGGSFTVFNSSNVRGLTSSTIRSLSVDHAGRLMIGTEWCGYGRLVDGAYHRSLYPDSHWNSTQYLYESADGTVWVGYRGYHFFLRDRKSRIDKIDAPGLYLTGIVNMPGYTLASMNYGGLFAVDDAGHATPFHTSPSIPINDFTSMVKTADGSIWCGTGDHGLFRIRNGAASHFDMSTGLSSNVVRCLFIDSARRLWIGTNKGVDSYDSQGFHHFGMADGLAADDVTSIAEDHEGNLWVATGIYLNRFANTRLTPISIGSPDVQEVGGISPAPGNNLYYCARSGLWIVPPKPNGVPEQVASWPTKLATTGADGKIYAAWSPNGRKWITGRLDGKTWTQHVIPYEPLKLIPMGSQVIIVGVHQEIQAFGAPTSVLVYPKAASNQFYEAIPDRHGTIWIGCNQGLAYFRNGHGGVVDCGLPAGAHVLSIDTSDPDCLWLGTDRGLARVWGNAYSTGAGSIKTLYCKLYGIDAGIPSNDCLQVLRDHDGKIWVGGYFGIMCVDEGQLAAYDKHIVKSLSIHPFTAADGIHYYPWVAMPAKTADGTLWFLGYRGVTMIAPDHLDHNALPPPVIVEEASANDQALTQGRSTRVSPGNGSLVVRYCGLSFVEPEKVLFRYKLDGFDTGWIYAGTRRVASYTNLPPGRYTFHVSACNNDGLWNDDGASVTFVLLPHFYETLWFHGLIALLCLMVLGAVSVSRTRMIERRARELEVDVAERTSELIDANRQLTAVQKELHTQNVQLIESQTRVVAQNDELHAMQDELMVQNDNLQSAQAELEAQNQELIETQDYLAEANTVLEGLATTDGLTSLYNHRTFHEQLEREWGIAMRHGMPLSLILLDVDRFKQYNDAFGHPAGDDVLRSVASIVKANARETDLVSRYGGEEFVVIAPQTDLAQAVELAERLRGAVDANGWPLRGITGSFGVAAIDGSTKTGADLIAHADAALYQSKNAGRNRVTAYAAPIGGQLAA